jgi:hypothetical protein
MANEPTIECPECHAEIPLSQSLAAPLIESTKRHYEQRLTQIAERTKEREDELSRQKEQLQAARDELEADIAKRLDDARKTISAEEAKRAREVFAAEVGERDKQLEGLREILEQRNIKLAEAQQAQAQLLKKERELDDQKRELELEVEKRVRESLIEERAKGRRDAESELQLKVAEKEQVISALNRQIADLKQRAEQGSQQLQGEAQEIVLEELIRARFPFDEIEPVPKGEHGGDVLHRVIHSPGCCAGTLLWESKRTKNWSDSWLAKLRADQRSAKADVAVLITQALPKAVEIFDCIDGVWVVTPRVAMTVCVALRTSLVEVDKVRRATEGQESKMQLVYNYLTGPQFKRRVEAIVEKFTEMQDDLEKERRTMTRGWAKRELQIRQVIDSTAGMYGDLQAIAGSTLLEIEGLGSPLLEAPANCDSSNEEV